MDNTSTVDLQLLYRCITNTDKRDATVDPKVEGLLEALLADRTVGPFNRAELYTLYLKYEAQLPHTKIGELTGQTYWAPRWLCRQLTKKLRAYLSGS